MCIAPKKKNPEKMSSLRKSERSRYHGVVVVGRKREREDSNTRQQQQQHLERGAADG
jgi:hypothetical protein